MLTIVGGTRLGIAVGGQGQSRLVGQVLHIGQQLFGHGQCAARAVFGQIEGKLLHFVGNLISWRYKIDEAYMLGFGGTQQIASKQQFTGFAFTQFARQKHRYNGRNKTNPHFGIAKIGPGYGKTKVGYRGQTASARNGVSLYLADDHLRARINHFVKLHQVTRIGPVFIVSVFLQLLQIAQVGTRTENFAFGTQNNDFAGIRRIKMTKGLL